MNLGGVSLKRRRGGRGGRFKERERFKRGERGRGLSEWDLEGGRERGKS